MSAKNWIRTVVAAVLTASFMAVPAVRADDVHEVTAEGRASIESGNVDGAKKAAMLDAKRNAVDQLGSEIVSKTIVQDYSIVKDQIISKAAGFVQDVTVIQEGQKGTEWVIQIKAKVSATKMADECELLYRDMDKPRVMVVVPQIKGDTVEKSTAIETRILGFFRNKGFEIVDAETAKANIQKDEVRLLAEGDTKAAAKVGLRSGAEVVILGDASAGKAESIMGELYSSNANVSLRAIQAANAKILAADSVMEKSVHGSADLAIQTALQKATDKVEANVFAQILKSWNQAALNGQRIEISLSGVANFADLKKAKALLQGVEGVTEIQQRSFERPTALFDVTFSGAADRLAELVDGKKREGVSIQVIGVSAGAIQATLK